MTPAILLVVSDGFGGYGDFIFALKLAQQLRDHYSASAPEVPPIYLVTQPSGQAKIRDLKGDIEFGIEILTPDELQTRVESLDEARRIEVGEVIQGPVFQYALIERVDKALHSLARRIPLYGISEYNAGDIEYLRKWPYAHLRYMDTISTGFRFRSTNSEHGILLNDALLEPVVPEEVVLLVDEPVKRELLGERSITEYQRSTELYMAYSHDKYTARNAALHFLEIHHQMTKDHDKSQDILLIGDNGVCKMAALDAMTIRLIDAGYTQISCYFSEIGVETIIYPDPGSLTEGPPQQLPQKAYRVILIPKMSHPSMMACMALSEPLVGVTGDQSFGEAVSAKKVIVYEEMSHKSELLYAYHMFLVVKSGHDPLIREALALLSMAETPKEYERLGVLLSNPAYDLVAKIRDLNAIVFETSHLGRYVANRTMHRIRLNIVSLLESGQQAEALALYETQRGNIRIFDKVLGKTLLEHARTQSEIGPFSRYFAENSDQLLLEYLAVNANDKACEIILTRGLILFDSLGSPPVTLDQACRTYGNQILPSRVRELSRQRVVDFLQEGRDDDALALLRKDHSIVIFDKVAGESIMDLARDGGTTRRFVTYFRDDPLAFIWQCARVGDKESIIRRIQSNQVNLESSYEGLTLREALRLLNYHDVIQMIMKQARAREEIVFHLTHQAPDKAWTLLQATPDIRIFDKVGDQMILDHAVSDEANYPFIQACYSRIIDQVRRYLILGQEEEAWGCIELTALDPFTEKEGPSLVQDMFELGCYGLISTLIQHRQSAEDQRQWCRLLVSPRESGETYLTALKEHAPAAHNPSTVKAICWYVSSQLETYHPKPGSNHIVMHESLKELVNVFNDTETVYDEAALIGLLLIIKRDIESEYRLLSPKKGLLFGNLLYSICDGLLGALAIPFVRLTLAQASVYYEALIRCLQEQPDFLRNEYIITSLSQEAGICFPAIPPVLSTDEIALVIENGPDAETSSMHSLDASSIDSASGAAFEGDIATESSGVLDLEAIFQQHLLDETANRAKIVWTSPTTFYAIKPTPLGQGNCGTVYVASYHALQDSEIVHHETLAVKHMNDTLVLDKEGACLKAVFPGAHVARFGQYLAMPLMPGVSLDRYLVSHADRTFALGQKIACGFLSKLQDMHAHGVTHNDLKPQNLMFDSVAEEIHLIDFGCAEPFETWLAYESVYTSIFAFEMPPEYLDGTETGPALDVYSATPLIAEMLALDKSALVLARIHKAFESIDDSRLKADLLATFWKTSPSLGDAFFTSPLDRHERNPNLERFVRAYVMAGYDFSPYSDRIGPECVTLLHEMQSIDPDARPTAAACFARLQAVIPPMASEGSDAQTMRTQLSRLKEAKESPASTYRPD